MGLIREYPAPPGDLWSLAPLLKRNDGKIIACVASVSVRFRSKERGTRVKDRATNGSRFISRAVKTENPLPRSFFAPKPNGNACYAHRKTRRPWGRGCFEPAFYEQICLVANKCHGGPRKKLLTKLL